MIKNRRNFIQLVTAAMVSSGLRGAEAGQAQFGTHVDSEMFCGVQLNRSGRTLLGELERKAGKSVRQHCLSIPGLKGHAEFSAEGTPQIFLNTHEADLEVVVHEFCHLLLVANGYPDFSITAAENVRASFPWSDVEVLLIRIQDDISHHVFFRRLRSAGFSPERPWLSEVQKLSVASWRQKDYHYIAEMLFRTYMEADNHETVASLEQRLTSNGMADAVELGRQMAESVGDLSNWTREKVLQAYLRCAALFLGGRIKLEFVRWTNIARGSVVIYSAQLRAVA